MIDLRHNDPDDVHGAYLAVSQRLGNGIGIEMVLLGIGFDERTPLLTDAGTVFERPRHRGHRYAQRAGNILHRDGSFVVHYLQRYAKHSYIVFPPHYKICNYLRKRLRILKSIFCE